MKYKIIELDEPQILVKYLSDDELKSEYMYVRVDIGSDGLLLSGVDLDNYILSFAPNLDINNIDPYKNINWDNIKSLIEIDEVYEKNKKKDQIITQIREIDLKSIQALRTNDIEKIKKYEDDVKKLQIEFEKLK
jgi:hypothetical protein